MAPLALKIKGNKSFSPLANMDSEEDLSKTWRVCTKVKDSLENGSRLENLSWRLWFRRHLLSLKSNGSLNSLSRTSNSQPDHHSSKLAQFKENRRNNKQAKGSVSIAAAAPISAPAVVIPNDALQQQQSLWLANAQLSHYNTDSTMRTSASQLQDISMRSSAAIQIPTLEDYDKPITYIDENIRDIDTEFGQQTFILHQFTSDQASDQMIELDDIFGSLGNLPTNINDAVDSMMSPGVGSTNTRNGIDFSTQWEFNEPDAPGNLYIPTNLVSPQYPQSLPQPQMHTIQVQQRHQQQPLTPVIFDGESTISRMTSFPMQQVQPSISYSMPSSPVLGPTHYQQQFQHIPGSSREATCQNELDYFGVNGGQTSSSMTRPLTQTLQNKIMNMPQAAGEPLAHHSTDLISPSLCASASTSPSSATSPSASPPNLMNQMNYANNIALSYPPLKPQTADGTQDQQLRLMQPTSPCSSTSNSPATTPFGGSAPITNHFPRPKKVTASATSSESTGGRPICNNCGATSTPLWRRSPNDELLCNACGLYQKLHNAPRPKTLKPNNGRKDSGEEEILQPECSNCFTATTPLWRRDEAGSPLCNACGLYLKLHHEQRPLSMKTDIIKKRQRYESGNNSSGGTRKPPNKKSKTEHSPSLEPSILNAQKTQQPVFLNHSQNSMTSSLDESAIQQYQQKYPSFVCSNQQLVLQQQPIPPHVDEVIQPQFL